MEQADDDLESVEPSEDQKNLRPVLAGHTLDGFEWLVTAGGSDEWFLTVLSVSHGETNYGSAGMGGAKLDPDSLEQTYEGRFPGAPKFVMVRTIPSIDQIIALTTNRNEISLTLSEADDEFELRFGVAVIRQDEELRSLRFVTAGKTVMISSAPL
jgi:hypothetical protein